MTEMELVGAPRMFQGAILQGYDHRPTLTGDGDGSLTCGNCGCVLVRGMAADEFAGSIFQCGACGSYNKPKVR